MARWLRIPIAVNLFTDIFSARHSWTTFRCRSGLPPDAELVDVTYHRRAQIVDLFFTHSSFPDVPIVNEVPALEVGAEFLDLEPGAERSGAGYAASFKRGSIADARQEFRETGTLSKEAASTLLIDAEWLLESHKRLAWEDAIVTCRKTSGPCTCGVHKTEVGS